MSNSTSSFYSVVYDDGEHSFEGESFPTRKEAITHIFTQIDEWTNGTGWDDWKEANPHFESLQIEVIKQDESGDVYEPLEGWDSNAGWMDIDESKKTN
jgi:hypothetical protein